MYDIIMDSDEKHVNLIENFRARLQALILVQPVLDHMHSMDNQVREQIRSRARADGDPEAANLLINAVLQGPRAPGWFREFVDALSHGGCSHAADYMDANPPPAAVEAENEQRVRLLQLLAPSLLDMKTRDVCVQCAAVGILTRDDVEKINAETTNNGNRGGARELLRRIVRSPPSWFSDFLQVLRDTEHLALYEELSGQTPDKKVSSSVPKQAEPAVEHSPVIDRCLDVPGESCVDLYNNESSESSLLQEDSLIEDLSINLLLSDSDGAHDEVLSLRDYQAEVAAPALEGNNIIICLPTGSGKTRVAVYVTREHLDARRREGRPGKVVILVNKIPLVEQHYSKEFGRFLKRDYKVDHVSGNSQLKISFPEIVRNNDVIICTAQILENHLSRLANEDDERVELRDLTLIVIDECHHTQKGGVYNHIMMRYLKQKHRNVLLRKEGKEAVSIPQILGLTASPGVGGATKSAKAEEHILKICANLDARKIMTRNDEDPKELYKKVAIVEERTKDPFGDVIKNIMRAIHAHAELHSTCDFGTQTYEQWVVQRESNAAKEEDQKVRVCADHLRRYNECLQLSNVIRMSDALEVLSDYQEEEMKKKEAPEEEKPIEITATERFLFNLFREKKEELRCLMKMPEFENNSLSTLRVQILQEFTSREKARGIIFTKTRRSAIALTQWVQGNPKFEDVGVKANYVIGGGDQSVVKPMTAAEQKDVLNKFRHGEVNLLIATTVAEEGLDIPEANFVIRYGLLTNEISMLQAQGRARAKNSSYTLVDVPGSGVIQKELVNDFRLKMMNKAIVKIKNMDQEEFNRKITTHQFEAIQEWSMLMTQKRKKKMKSDSPSEVSFSCRSCNKLLCTGEDIEVVAQMHHVVVSTQFGEHYNKKENTSLQERLVEYETNSFVACKKCGQRWGSMMLYRGIELPTLHVKNLVVTYKGKKMGKCTKWRELAVIFPAFDLSAHASLMDHTWDEEDAE